MSVRDQLEDFCTQLRRRQIEGSLATGRRTAELLRIFISTNRHSDALALVEDVRSVGNKLQAAKPIGLLGQLSCWNNKFCTNPDTGSKMRDIATIQSADLTHLCSHAELAIGNITRRILHMIREESEEVCCVQEFSHCIVSSCLLILLGF